MSILSEEYNVQYGYTEHSQSVCLGYPWFYLKRTHTPTKQENKKKQRKKNV